MTRDDHCIIMSDASEDKMWKHLSEMRRPEEHVADPDSRRTIKRVALAILCFFLIAAVAWFVFIRESGNGYTFADCRTIELSRAQTEGARERLEALEAAERLNLLEYRLDLLQQRLRSLWDAATKDRLT